MGQRSAERATMAHRRVANECCNVREHRCVLGNDVGRFDFDVLGHRANSEMAISLTNIAKVANTSYIDEYRWSSKPELHHGNQRVTASKKLGLVTVFT